MKELNELIVLHPFLGVMYVLGRSYGSMSINEQKQHLLIWKNLKWRVCMNIISKWLFANRIFVQVRRRKLTPHICIIVYLLICSATNKNPRL